MAAPDDRRRALPAALRLPLALIDGLPFGAAISPAHRDRAERAAGALGTACGDQGIALVATVFAADLLAAIAIELAADRDAARQLIVALRDDGGLAPAALGREVLASPHVLELPPELALEVILALVLVFSGGEAIALSTPDEDGGLTVDCRVGEVSASTLSASTGAARFATRQRPPGVVRIDGIAAGDPTASVLVTASAVALDHHRRRAAPAEAASAAERRLARLRFDLHDGPQQEIHLLGQDLRLFRTQLQPMIAGHADEGRVLGRLDDLEAQLEALDGGLRQLATTFTSPLLAPDALADRLRQLTEAFTERTGVRPRTTVRGSLTSLTDSQRIALLSLIREALSNIRRHADADRVQIVIEADPESVRVQVTDDGCGFDPEPTRARAARAGRLGLVGMYERVRMLGGSTRIESRPGGPTVVTASFPPWAID